MPLITAGSHGEQLAKVFSRLCGWTYFLLWSASFYPQPLLNLRRKTTQGLTPDFPLLNVFGFTCYTISTALFLFSPVIRAQYAVRHPVSPQPTVRYNDLAFGAHACVLCMITYSQLWPRIWGLKQNPGGRRYANSVTLGLLWGSLLATLVIIIIVRVRSTDGNGNDGRGWAWIDVVYCLTYIKLLLTFFKYIPQVMANYRRKSTIGWSITQQALDFGGGVLSMLQLVIDSALQADWSGLTGNPVKVGLANISLLFDIIFIAQHVYYGPVQEKGASGHEEVGVDPAHGSRGEDDPLLPADEQAGR